MHLLSVVLQVSKSRLREVDTAFDDSALVRVVVCFESGGRRGLVSGGGCLELGGFGFARRLFGGLWNWEGCWLFLVAAVGRDNLHFDGLVFGGGTLVLRCPSMGAELR